MKAGHGSGASADGAAGAPFSYDVAFSCLAGDEELASKIESRVRDRLSTFLYSERQREIAGRDGEKLFNEVFGSAARTVVVFYRERWGTTPFTRIEETAIRNRAFKAGYEFVTFIPLDSPPGVPEWIPKNRIWVDLARLGIDGVVAVIEERVRELGSAIREETPADRAARMERERRREAEKDALFHREEGVDLARAEMDRLRPELTAGASSISTESMPFRVGTATASGGTVSLVYGPGVTLSVGLEIFYRNSLDGSQLGVVLWRGHAPYGRGVPTRRPEEMKKRHFTFDLAPGGEPGWRESAGAKRFFTTSQLVEECLTLLLDGVDGERRRTR